VALTGTLDDLTCAELLQMLNLGRKNGTLVVRSGRREATVHLRDGDVVHAVMGDSSGADAVYRVLGMVGGEFEFSRCTDPMPRTITSSTESLILEGARRWDEFSQLEDEISQENPVLRVRLGAVEIIPSLGTTAKIILDLVDARRDIATIVRESGIEPEDALDVVRALIADGIVEPWVDGRPPVRDRVPVDSNLDRGDLKIVVGVNNADRPVRRPAGDPAPEETAPRVAEALLAG
jgi:hypothetical protein